jgi:hypothetical protein
MVVAFDLYRDWSNGVWLALMRLAGSGAHLVGIGGVAAAAITIARRVFRWDPVEAAATGWLAGILASAGCGFVVSCLTAFSPPPEGAVWLGGGGWETIALATMIFAGFGGLPIGFAVAVVYIILHALRIAAIRFRDANTFP